MSRGVFGQLVAACLAVAFGSLAFVGVYAARSIGAIQQQALRTELEARARMLAHLATPEQLDRSDPELDRLCKTLGTKTQTRLTLMRADGRVVGESMEDPAQMEPHHTRPEVIAALTGDTGENIRYSATLGERMLYVAVPIHDDARLVLGAARVALPLTAVQEQRSALRRRLAAGGVLAAILACALSLIVSRRIARPIGRMQRGAERFADGELGAHLPVEGPDEVRRLAVALNRMAVELRQRFEAITAQRNEREAVLAAMTEGVLTVGADGRLRDCNAAAARLLNTTQASARGRAVAEAVRNSALQELIDHVLRTGRAGECDLVFRTPHERFIQARAVPIELNGNGATGALIVMADVTRLKRLENVRRDFVANVSHELKTPITSIRAACETLLDERPAGEKEPPRFLEMIDRQSARLESMVEDLLSLSRIEHDGERGGIRRERAPVRPVLEAAAAHCFIKAASRGVQVRMECGDELAARLNPALLEQAMVNLIDNAIKYSPAKGEVRVTCEGDEHRIRIQVADQGPGIAPEHQERIFERFYCVDPGRSRKLGGTGLGLAIVKHIALAHGGSVHVDSRPGGGSAFIIELPA